MEPSETQSGPSSSSTERISRAPTNWPLVSPTTRAQDNKRVKRKQSLRVRPTEYLENAEPPSPLNFSIKSSAVSTASRMSLFHLFSRPKVERQRGYAEKGVDVSQSRNPRLKAASTPNLVVQVQPPTNGDICGPPTPMSLQTNGTKSTPKVKWKEQPPRDPAERRNGVFDPPPLFQAYPQSLRDGMLEVSDITPEAVLHKARGKKSKAEMNVGEDGQSYRTKKSAKSTFKHVGHGDSLNVDMAQKIFVLVTSGYLLQYAGDGPSDRLPEKMLHLGKDSAAFACDLLPGKHYVLQVSQAVDHEGVIVAPSSSIFSKLGIRSAAAKRMTSGFLLVMPSGREMALWMAAIRQEIEYLGGKKINPDIVSRPKTGETGTDLKKTPSQSHRYQVKRNPSKVAKVMSPEASAVSSPTLATFQLPSPTQSAFLVPSPIVANFPPSPSRSPKIEEEKEDSDAATIDGIELEASKLDEEAPKASPRKRAPSDVPSISSSAVVSVEHQQLSNIRNSGCDSTRTSHTSQAGTVVTASGTSRTNSLVGSPPSPGLLAGTLEPARDNVAPLKQPYRPMISANFNVTRRRSAVTYVMANGQTPASLNTSPAKQRTLIVAEMPVTGQQSSSPPRTTSPPSRLTSAQSEPNLKALASTIEKHDSKVSTAPPMATLVEGERPESFVGDLPDPSTWSSARAAPGRRTSSLIHAPFAQNSAPQSEASRPTEQQLVRPKRMSFSMPLKVNPSTPNNGTPPIANNRRRSQLGTPDAAGEQPTIHTLTAKVDSGPKQISLIQAPPTSSNPNGGTVIPKRASVSQFNQPVSFSNPNRLSRTPSDSPGARLSLFPSAITLPATGPPEPPIRSSSATANPTNIQADGQTLRRPTSMQVRSDHAPFLQSLRNSTGPLDGRAVPIRGMKPSRSASNVAALASQTPSPGPTSTFTGLKFDTPTLSEEADEATPLPDMDRGVSPLPTSRPGSRSGSRRGLKTRSALPELDLGIPVVGLGPPAPPPSAPLPAPPPASRTTSPSPMPIDAANVHLTSGIDTVAGLGIQVS